MARPFKATVEYFPHFCNSGKTIGILQSKFGNTGYAFWFKLLELLGISEGHYYDFNKLEEWEFLLSKTCVDEVTANDILITLAGLNAIDGELIEKKIIWCQNFVNNLAEVYKRRKNPLPERPDSQRSNNHTPIIEDDTIPDPVFATMVKAFEDNIGQVTPMMAERIKAIQADCPEGWFEKAVNEAVSYGHRNMKYIEAVLENWKVNGITTTKKETKEKPEKEYKF